jgi:thymidylate synthase
MNLGDKNYHADPFRKIYDDLLNHGKMTHPRGTTCLEIENYVYELPPYVRFTNFVDRKLNLNYIKNEFLWYLRGDKYDTSICNHASMWKNLICRDGSIRSNYGQYIFGMQKQFDVVVEELKRDKDTRRAVIMILGVEQLLIPGPEISCTYSMSFRIRENKLNMSVRMRSQDSVYGLGNDVPSFSFVHEMVYVSIKDNYPGLELGVYCHSADSFHVYEKHFQMIDNIRHGSEYILIDCPLMSSLSEVTFMRAGNSESVPEEYLFTRWIQDNGVKK